MGGWKRRGKHRALGKVAHARAAPRRERRRAGVCGAAGPRAGAVADAVRTADGPAPRRPRVDMSSLMQNVHATRLGKGGGLTGGAVTTARTACRANSGVADLWWVVISAPPVPGAPPQQDRRRQREGARLASTAAVLGLFVLVNFSLAPAVQLPSLPLRSAHSFS